MLDLCFAKSNMIGNRNILAKFLFRFRSDWQLLWAAMTAESRQESKDSSKNFVLPFGCWQVFCANCSPFLVKTVWPSGLRRWLKAPVRKGVGSNPTAVISLAHVLALWLTKRTGTARASCLLAIWWFCQRLLCGSSVCAKQSSLKRSSFFWWIGIVHKHERLFEVDCKRKRSSMPP